VEQIGLLDGLDVYLLLYPIGALFGCTFLLKFVSEFELIVTEDKSLLFCPGGIKPISPWCKSLVPPT